MRRSIERLFGIFALFWIASVFFLAVLMLAITPGLRRRRAITRHLTAFAFRAGRLPITLEGLEHLPEAACVVVANHASYLDGLILTAALPPRFAFVIKNEVTKVPLVHFLLQRIGSQFVERVDRHRGAADTRRILRLARDQQSLAFFPEGTFVSEPGLAKFRSGAFAAAAKASLPIVPVVINGSRKALDADSWIPLPRPIHVRILSPLLPDGHDRDELVRLRGLSREAILSHLDEPDLAPHTTANTQFDHAPEEMVPHSAPATS